MSNFTDEGRSLSIRPIYWSLLFDSDSHYVISSPKGIQFNYKIIIVLLLNIKTAKDTIYKSEINAFLINIQKRENFILKPIIL